MNTGSNFGVVRVNMDPVKFKVGNENESVARDVRPLSYLRVSMQ